MKRDADDQRAGSTKKFRSEHVVAKTETHPLAILPTPRAASKPHRIPTIRTQEPTSTELDIIIRDIERRHRDFSTVITKHCAQPKPASPDHATLVAQAVRTQLPALVSQAVAAQLAGFQSEVENTLATQERRISRMAQAMEKMEESRAAG